MVDVDDEARPVGRLERLGDRWPAAGEGVAAVHEGIAVEGAGRADRGHRIGAIQEADLDGVGPGGVELPGLGVDIDERVGVVTGGVQLVDQVGDRAVGSVAVVLDLVDPDHIGIEPEDGGDRLGPLPVEFGLGVRATAVRGQAADAEVAVVVARRVRQAVKGVEVVEEVEAGNTDVAPDLDRRAGPGVGRLEVHVAATQRR